MSKKILQSSSMSSKTPRFLAPSSPAAEIVFSDVDLLTEILLWVPAKPLLKFKCVSKCWRSLISDPQFGFKHTRRNPTPTVSGLYFDAIQRVTPVPPSQGDHPTAAGLPTFSFLHVGGIGSAIRISQASNGLMLLSFHVVHYVIVCNPSTQKFTVLPSSISSPSELQSFWYEPTLVFEPSKSPHYKVVLVRCYDGSNTSRFDIYSSATASWKNICLSPSIGKATKARGAVWNGSIIWMSCKNVDSPVYFQFDVDAENLTTHRVSPPDPDRDRNLLSEGIMYFGGCGGRLLLIPTPSYNAVEFQVLEMDRDDGFCWIVKYRVDLTLLGLRNRSSCRFQVLTVMNGAKENDTEVVFYFRGEAILYNLECKTLKVLGNVSPHEIHCKYSYQFIPSLSPV